MMVSEFEEGLESSPVRLNRKLLILLKRLSLMLVLA